MDYFWVMLLIFGAIVTIGQKSQKGKTSGDEAEIPDPSKEWERRLREILEQGEPSPNAAPKTKDQHTTLPRPKSAHRQGRSQHPSTAPQQADTARTTASGYTSSIRSSYNASSTPFGQAGSSGAKAANTAKNNAQTTLPAAAEEGSEIERMIDDFTIEKAVIYAEILRPKYEEY